MHLLLLMLAGCTPHDAEITGSFHAWLAKNSSATIREGRVPMGDATLIDCRAQVDDEITPEEGSVCSWGTPNPADSELTEPEYFSFTANDAFYLKQGALDAWRSEAVMTSEGDFQLTVHHDLGKGQDFRFVFVIDPAFDPFICIQAGQTCYVSGDDDGDGWADYQDPDCLSGGWELGFSKYDCNNGLDDDGDGQIDTADSGCENPFSTEGPNTCRDQQDNDGDGYTDGNDADCEFYNEEDGLTNSVHACSDGIDNDGDGLIDKDDKGCDLSWDNQEDGPTDDNPCRDDYDNDGDGWVDEDNDCDRFDDEAGLSSFGCNDGLDNDEDGLVDAEDPGCLFANDNNEADYETVDVDGVATNICADGEDNDGDGWEDEDDADCVLGSSEDGTYDHLFQCSDGLSVDEGDDKVDSDDRDCESGLDNNEDDNFTTSSCKESDNLDDDGDGWANADDPDCLVGSQELGHSGLTCNDNLDNDGDGLVDALDPGCISPFRALEDDLVDSDCADGEDNDGDGWTDEADPGCLMGVAEGDFITACSDGVDNDGDGYADGAFTDDDGNVTILEPECAWGFDELESSTNTCADGVDNDGDGWADQTDPDCANPGYERGFYPSLCADGIDNDGDGDIDGLDSGCTSALDPWEEDSDQCADGLDNDGDGWADDKDSDCILLARPYEDGSYTASQCSDGVDNDSDGFADALDGDCTSALDNIEAYEDPGDPTRFPLDYSSNLTEWSDGEDGTLYYLNAGAYQQDPTDDTEYWSLPQEWLAGYAHSKFAAEEFDVYPGDYFYVGDDALDPNPEGYAAVVAEYAGYANTWSQELGTYAGMTPADFEMKVEGNEWRPVNLSQAGLDNWIEVHSSWVRVDNGSQLEVGGAASGEFQIYLTGYEAASELVIKGNFKIDAIDNDPWGYSVLEDDKHEENGTVPCQ